MVVSDAALGDAIVEYHRAHWDELGVEYIIWQQRMLSSPGGSWKRMSDRGSGTANHMDHPHVNYRVSDRSSPRLRAVLFDMDGTLVETEGYWGEAMAELAVSSGWADVRRGPAATVGTSMRTSMGILHADLGVVRDRGPAAGRRPVGRGPDGAAMSYGIAWQPGARDLLSPSTPPACAAALVTTTPRSIAEIVLGRSAGTSASTRSS